MSCVEEETKGKIPYKFGEKIQPYSKKKSYLLCPECSQPVKLGCLCALQDSVCENGHKWHIEIQDKKLIVVKGEGIH